MEYRTGTCPLGTFSIFHWWDLIYGFIQDFNHFTCVSSASELRSSVMFPFRTYDGWLHITLSWYRWIDLALQPEFIDFGNEALERIVVVTFIWFTGRFHSKCIQRFGDTFTYSLIIEMVCDFSTSCLQFQSYLSIRVSYTWWAADSCDNEWLNNFIFPVSDVLYGSDIRRNWRKYLVQSSSIAPKKAKSLEKAPKSGIFATDS